MNSNKYAGNRMHANLYYNTFEGVEGNAGSLIYLKYRNGTERLGAHIYNNIFMNSHTPLRLVDHHIVTGPLYDVDIRNNWWEGPNKPGKMSWPTITLAGTFENLRKAIPSLGETPTYEPLGAVRKSVTDLGAYDLDKL